MTKVKEDGFHLRGISLEGRTKVKDIVSALFREGEGKPGFFSRCTFFAYDGIDILTELVSKSEFTNPRIEGCDEHSTDQHYWLAFDVSERPLIIDPFFKYVGLEEHAGDVLDNKKLRYYENKRIVPDKYGVNVKTFGV